MTRKTFETLGIKESKVGKMISKWLLIMIRNQKTPEKIFELIGNDKETNEKEKLWISYNVGSAMELSADKKFKSLEEKDEKLAPIMIELTETTKTYSEIILKVLKMEELTLREKIVLCFNTGRIVQAFYGPTVPQPPGMKSRFTR